MRCPICENQAPDDSVFCTFCGNQLPPKTQEQSSYTYNGSSYSYQQPSHQQPSRSQIDDAGCLALFISFVQPFIGFALYLVWKDYRPNSAKTCLTVAIVSLVLSIVGGVIMAIVGLLAEPFIEFGDLENIQKIINFFIT
ncbi:MAG TPA: hypothetical protein GX745_06115 [Clostridiales bacterium]|nr:hypothetical protein [Clostridiales bacterium]